RVLFYLLAGLGIYLNIWWTHNAHRGSVPVFTYATKEYYWEAVGRWKIDKSKFALLDNKYLFHGEPPAPTILYTNDFSTDSTANRVEDGIQGASLQLNASLQYSQEYKVRVDSGGGEWVRVYADCRSTHKEWDVWKQAQFIVKIYYHGNLKVSSQIRVFRFLNDNDFQRLSVDVNTEEMAWDEIGILFWNANSDKTLIIDNVEIITFHGTER